MTDSISELINHEAVYRTAPATPGLLISHKKDTGCFNFVGKDMLNLY